MRPVARPTSRPPRPRRVAGHGGPPIFRRSFCRSFRHGISEAFRRRDGPWLAGSFPCSSVYAVGMDALAGLLDGPRARGAFVLRVIMEPPWSVRIQDGAPLSLVAVVRGDAWVVPDADAAA